MILCLLGSIATILIQIIIIELVFVKKNYNRIRFSELSTYLAWITYALCVFTFLIMAINSNQ